MTAITNFLAGRAAIAALAVAAPAGAQYYPGYGYGAPYEGNPVGEVLNNIFGGGYAANGQAAVNQCANAVQMRLNGGYGYNGYGGGRVLGVSRVEQRSNGGLTVRGVATSGRYAGYSYGAQPQVDLTWTCKTDIRGFITQLDVNRAQPNYGYTNNYNYNSSPYDYSPYGYHRY